MSGFCAFFAGVNIESVSHPKDLAEANRYFKRRYSTSVEHQLVVVSADSTQAEFKAAKELSMQPPKMKQAPNPKGISR